jgi:hypothetical protein
MRRSTLRDELRRRLLDFAWAEWSQMGLPAGIRSRSAWAQDPEALVVFTLEIGRDDPRLFDEVMAWIAANDALLSVRRLRAMCTGPEDVRLVDAARRWLDGLESRQISEEPGGELDSAQLEPFFRGLGATAVRELDPAFASMGFLRPRLERGVHAGAPDLRLPINLAFRLRYLLGVSVRAEVVRHLLTVRGEFVITQVIAGSAGYARRNVQDALAALRRAGVVEVRTSSGFMHWGTDPRLWCALLDLDEPPVHRDWPHLLSGLREVLRWLGRADLDDLSDYLLGSQARDLLERVRDPFQRAGVLVGDADAEGAWGDLEAVVASGLELLDEM